MERGLYTSLAGLDDEADSTPAAELAWLTAAIPAEAGTCVLIGASSGAGLGEFIGQRGHLKAIVLEPDPRAAEALRQRLFSWLGGTAERLAILSGPNYSGSAEVAHKFPDIFQAPLVIHPDLERTHPREVARARNIVAKLVDQASVNRRQIRHFRPTQNTQLASATSPLGPRLVLPLSNLDGIRLLSLDVFDTLLIRSVDQPADVFPIVGRRAVEQGALAAEVTPSRFRILRQTSEARARHAKRRLAGTAEVSLAEIYAAWPDISAIEGPALIRVELEVEAELVYAHPGTLALVHEARARGIKTALVSDTYFATNELCALLVAAGIAPQLFDVILSSSQAGSSKQDGQLFERLLSHWPGLPSGAVLHVGDNAHADVRQAQRAGLKAVQHDTGRHGMARDAMRLEAVRHGSVLPELGAMRAIASTIDTPASEEDQWYFALGASVLGPALATFADWIVSECLRDDVRAIRPLMREGALFANLIARSAAVRGAGLDVKPLYVSRSATWLASLDTFDETSVHRLLERRHLSIAEALRGLDLEGLPEVAALEPFADCTLGSTHEITTPDGRSLADAVVACLGSESVRRRVNHGISRARDLLRDYLDDACAATPDVALVDLGFRCSIGRAIESVTRQSSTRRYHHFLLFAAASVSKLWAEGADVRVFGAGPVDDADLAGPIARHPGLLEALLIEGGTTHGYQRHGAVVTPILGDNAAPLAQQTAAAACRAGIQRFQECWLDWSVRHPALSRHILSNRRTLTIPIHRLITMPTCAEAARLGAFVHEDNEGGQSVRPLADASGLPGELTPEEFQRVATSGAVAFGRSWLWPAAVCEQRWPGFLEQHWRDAAGSTDGAPPLMPAVATRMRRSGVRECVVWGAGEAGVALIRAVRREGITVRLVTDSNPMHWGTELDGVPIVAPGEAYRRGNHTFAIGSCAFAADIERTVREHYETTSDAVRIFSPLSEVAA